MTNTLFELNTIDVPSISSSAMLVTMNVSKYSGVKKDKKAAQLVEGTNQAARGATTVTKKLLGHCRELSMINSYIDNTRNRVHYYYTHPWIDNGPRLLHTSKYFDYHNQITHAQNELAGMVERFLVEYDQIITEARSFLGNLFDANEYPTADDLKSRFAIRVEYMPVPDSGDWRLDVSSEANSMLQNHYAALTQNKIQTVANDIWHKLYNNLEALTRGLDVREDGTKGKIYDAVFNRTVEMIDTLRKCNLTGDTKMTRMSNQLEQALYGLNTEMLKHNTPLRVDTKNKLDDIMKSLPSLDI